MESPDEYERVEAASLVTDHPNVWSDGGLVLDQVTGVSSSGAGFCAHQSENCWSGRRWGHVDGVRIEVRTRHGGIPQGLSFEHDVYCCAVLALVPVSCCTGGSSAAVVADNLKSISGDPGVLFACCSVHHWLCPVGWSGAYSQ